MRLIDLTNKQFGNLTVMYRVYPNNLTKKHTYWKCKCKCGKETVVSSNHLRTGHTKSCGCSHNYLKGSKSFLYKHGKRNTRLYGIWATMKSRCLNKNNIKYKNYGARGISIYSKWTDKENGFMNFYNWAINNGYIEKLTLDRIDVNGNYEPNNCRWITLKEQNYNKTTTKYLTYKHRKKPLIKWAEEYHINHNTLYKRIKTGWDIEKALTTPTS